MFPSVSLFLIGLLETGPFKCPTNNNHFDTNSGNEKATKLCYCEFNCENIWTTKRQGREV